MGLIFFAFFTAPPLLLAAAKWVLRRNIFFDGVPDNPGHGHLLFPCDAFQLCIEIGWEAHRCAGTFLRQRVLFRYNGHGALPIIWWCAPCYTIMV